jgi:hypothetical protein
MRASQSLLIRGDGADLETGGLAIRTGRKRAGKEGLAKDV